LMKTNSKSIVHLMICMSILITSTLTCNFLVPVSPVTALALKFDGAPSLAVYIGNPRNNIFWLPAGEYYIEAVDSDGKVYEGWREVVHSDSDGGNTVAISQRVRGNGRSDEAIASQLKTLAEFMITVDIAQLTYLETASNGFRSTFKNSMDSIQMSDADPFYANLQEIADMREAVFAAIQALESRAQQAVSDSQQDGDGVPAGKVLPRLRLGIWESLENFLSFKNEEDEKARLEIMSVSAAMTPVEKEEAFYWLNTEKIGGAQNYDEFLQLLQEGRLENITSIRSDLYNGGPYQGVYQTINPDSNRPGGENIHRAGTELIQRGAELEFEIIKEVLTAAFPEIQKGLEYADKATRWAGFVKNMYVNPLETVQDMTIDKIKSGIQERVQLDLMSVMPDLDEEIAEQLAGDLTDEIMNSQPALATAIAESRNNHEPNVTGSQDPGEALTQNADTTGESSDSAISPPPSTENDFNSECLASGGAYTWTYEDFRQDSGTGGVTCNARFVFKNLGNKPLSLIVYAAWDNNAMQFMGWKTYLLKPGGVWEEKVSRTNYTDGTVTYSKVERILVVNVSPECAYVTSNENQSIWDLHSQSIDEITCP
jgi:hypothetical protein